MIEDLKQNVKHWDDEEEVGAYLAALLHKEAFDRAGLIYGMGHAVYSISDPRANIFKAFVKSLSGGKGTQGGIPALFPHRTPRARDHRQGSAGFTRASAPTSISTAALSTACSTCRWSFTPHLRHRARISGWCAHRIEELINAGKIIRPAYKSVAKHRPYTPIAERN